MPRKKATTGASAPAGTPRSARSEQIDALLSTLRGKYKDRIFSGRDYTMPWAVRRLPFGIPDLDIATAGGAPAGGITMLVGQPNLGKNYLLNRLITKQQELYGEDCAIAVIGTEMAYDKSQGRKVGVSVALSDAEIEVEDKKMFALDGRHLTDDERAELQTQIGHFVVIPPSVAEESFDIAVSLVKSGQFNIVALDSFGSILPRGDEDKDLMDGEGRVAGAAGLNSQLMRKLNNAFAPLPGGAPNLTCFVGINQVRDALKAQAFMKQTHESGGWALKHGRFLTIEITRIASVKDSDKKRLLGKTIKWEVTKQKAGGWDGHVGQYNYIMAESGIDMGELLLRLGQEYELISKSGNTYTYAGLTLGVGAVKAASMILSCDLVDELTEEILAAARVTFVT